MSFSEKSLLVPRRGLIMRADPHTAPPDFYDPSFDPTNPGGGWTTLGHHSRENLAKLTKDGGEKTVLSSWWTESLVEIVTESIKWGFEFSQVQVDKATLALAFPGGRVTPLGGFAVGSELDNVESAVILYMQMSRGKGLAIYGPRVPLTINEIPDPAVDEFFELNISGTALAASEDVLVGADVELEVGETIAIYPPVALT